jgi:hypothetical protein
MFQTKVVEKSEAHIYAQFTLSITVRVFSYVCGLINSAVSDFDCIA